MTIAFAFTAVAVSLPLPEELFAEMAHIGRGVPADTLGVTLLSMVVFGSVLFLGTWTGAAIFASISKRREVWDRLILVCLFVLPGVGDWTREGPGDEMLAIRLAWIMTVVAGVEVGSRIPTSGIDASEPSSVTG